MNATLAVAGAVQQVLADGSDAGTSAVLPDYTTNLLLANLAVAVLLPNLVALVTARVAQPPLKSLILLVLSSISGVCTQVVTDGGDFHWRAAILSVGQVFFAAVTAHYGLLKPTGVTGSDGAIQTTVTGGLGKNGGLPPLTGPDNRA